MKQLPAQLLSKPHWELVTGNSWSQTWVSKCRRTRGGNFSLPLRNRKATQQLGWAGLRSGNNGGVWSLFSHSKMMKSKHRSRGGFSTLIAWDGCFLISDGVLSCDEQWTSVKFVLVMINQADVPVSLAVSNVDSLNISFCFLVCAGFSSRWEAFAHLRPADALTWSTPAASALPHTRVLSPAECPPFKPVLLTRKNNKKIYMCGSQLHSNRF